MDWAVSTGMTLHDGVSATFKRMAYGADHFGDAADHAFKKASHSSSRFGDIVKGVLTADLLKSGVGFLKDQLFSVVTAATKIEDATAAFTPLMGGAAQAEKLVARLNMEAATTPYQFEGISKIAKQILPVMNGSIEDTAKTFRMLGDTAGGNIEKLDSITRGYVKALLKGKPDMESLNMISEAGVPVIQEMAKSLHVSTQQLLKMSSQGKITNAQLTQTFKNMTSEGGIFFNGMKIASETMTGKFSTFSDTIEMTKAALGSALAPSIKKVLDIMTPLIMEFGNYITQNKELITTKVTGFFNGLVEVGKELWPVISFVASAIGTLFYWIYVLRAPLTAITVGFLAFKTIMLGMTIIQSAVAAFAFLQSAITGAGGAMALFNAILYANPIVWIIALIAALIGIVVASVIYWDQLSDAVSGAFQWFDNLGPVLKLILGTMFPIIGAAYLLWKYWDKITGAVKSFLGIQSDVEKVSPKLNLSSDTVAAATKNVSGPPSPGGAMGMPSISGGGAPQLPSPGGAMGMPSISGGGAPQLPSRAQIAAPTPESMTQKMKLEFYGRIDVYGLPGESKFTRTGGNAPAIDVKMLGENK